MTIQLIPIFSGAIANESALLCNARDLHSFLQIGKRFASWITERISEYGFIENQDFILVSQNREIKGRGGDRRSKNYHLSLDTAKELAMVERNDKGRQVRRYFIECEKRLRQRLQPERKNTTTDQRTPLRDAVNLLVGKKGVLYPDAYSMIHQRFNVDHIDELKPAQLPAAIEYIHRLALNGEFIPATESQEPTPELWDLYHLGALYNHFNAIYDVYKEQVRPAMMTLDSPAPYRLNGRFADGSIFLKKLKHSLEQRAGCDMSQANKLVSKFFLINTLS